MPAAFLVRRADPEHAWAMALRDARKHGRSMRRPEPAFAGALDSTWAATSYDGEIHDLPAFGRWCQTIAGPATLRSLDLY